jgi:hypothetical protein
MKDRVLLGESRREAITRVQERLGPATSRPLAEQTFWALAKKGQITMDKEGVYLIEADLEDSDMRDTAKDTIKQQQTMNRPRMRTNARHFQMNHNSMHQARVSTSWKAAMSSMKTSFSPSLSGAEGYQGAADVPNDNLPPIPPQQNDDDDN